MSTAQHLARIGAAATFIGAVLLIVSTLLHPLDSDPADTLAAFAEYATDTHYVWTHLGQFAGFFGLGIGLVAFAGTFESGRAAAWGRVGAAGAVASIAMAAALQAVDGVALKATVDRWVAADGEVRPLVYEAAHALRWIEIGLASFLSILSGLTLIAFGSATRVSARYPAWLGAGGVVVGLGMSAAGAVQAKIGFSRVAMALSMASCSAFLLWALVAAVLMWHLTFRRRGGRNSI